MNTITDQRQDLIREVQEYCAALVEAKSWTPDDGIHVASLLNEDADPYGLFIFMDEQPGDWRVGYKTLDGREWLPAFRQMRNVVGSGLMEHLLAKTSQG